MNITLTSHPQPQLVAAAPSPSPAPHASPQSQPHPTPPAPAASPVQRAPAARLQVKIATTAQQKQVQQETFIQYLSHNISSKNLYTQLAVMGAFNEYYQNTPIKDKNSMQAQLQKLNQILSKNPPQAFDPLFPEEAVTDAFGILKSASTVLGPEVPMLMGVGKLGFKWLNKSVQNDLAKYQGSANIDYSKRIALQQAMHDSLQKTHDLIVNDPIGYGQMVQDLFPDILNGASPAFSAEDYAAIDPNFANTAHIAELERLAKGNQLDTSTLRKLVEGQFVELRASIHSQTQLLKDIKAYHTKQTKDAKEAADLAKREAESTRLYRLKLQATEAGLNILSNLIVLGGNPKLGQQIQGVGNTALQMGHALDQFAEVSQTAEGLELALNGVLLVNNLLSGGLALASLFGGSGRSDMSFVMDELQSIHGEIREMRQEMRDYFVAIDRKLNNIIELVLENHRLILETHHKLDAIQADLKDLQTQLTSVRYEMKGYFQELLSSQLASDKDIQHCLQGPQNFYNSEVTTGRYQSCLLASAGYAIRASGTKIASIPPPPEMTAEGLDIYLKTHSPIDMIQFLAEMVAKMGVTSTQRAIDKGRLINPYVWMTGASAYLGVLSGWPQYQREVKPDAETLQKMITIGEQLRDMVLDLYSIETADGHRKVNTDLLKRLLSNYSTAQDRFARQLRTMEKRYIRMETDWSIQDNAVYEQPDCLEGVRNGVATVLSHAYENSPWPQDSDEFEKRRYISDLKSIRQEWEEESKKLRAYAQEMDKAKAWVDFFASLAATDRSNPVSTTLLSSRDYVELYKKAITAQDLRQLHAQQKWPQENDTGQKLEHVNLYRCSKNYSPPAVLFYGMETFIKRSIFKPRYDQWQKYFGGLNQESLVKSSFRIPLVDEVLEQLHTAQRLLTNIDSSERSSSAFQGSSE